MCVDVCEYTIGFNNISSKLRVISSQNASGPGLDPVVPLGKQLDRERIHGKLLRNNLCVSVACLLLSSVSHFNSRGISVSSEQNQKIKLHDVYHQADRSVGCLVCLDIISCSDAPDQPWTHPVFWYCKHFSERINRAKDDFSESQNLWQDRENFWFETVGFNSASRIYVIKATGHVHPPTQSSGSEGLQVSHTNKHWLLYLNIIHLIRDLTVSVNEPVKLCFPP